LRVGFGLNIVAITSKDHSGGELINPIPEADYKIKEQDKLMIVGSNENIEKLKKKE